MNNESAKARALDFAKMLGRVSEVRTLKTGASIWVDMNNRMTRVMRIPLEYPDHVIIPKGIYKAEMGPIQEQGRTTGSAIIRREFFQAEVWARRVREIIA